MPAVGRAWVAGAASVAIPAGGTRPARHGTRLRRPATGAPANFGGRRQGIHEWETAKDRGGRPFAAPKPPFAGTDGRRAANGRLSSGKRPQQAAGREPAWPSDSQAKPAMGRHGAIANGRADLPSGTEEKPYRAKADTQDNNGLKMLSEMDGVEAIGKIPIAAEPLRKNPRGFPKKSDTPPRVFWACSRRRPSTTHLSEDVTDHPAGNRIVPGCSHHNKGRDTQAGKSICHYIFI